MIDEKYLELIHADIDGELPEQQRAELSRYLLANPEARAFREELRRVCAALDGIEQVEPPEGLRESILEALSAQRAARRFAMPRVFRTSPLALRYAAAFVGGLLVSAIAFQVGTESRDGLGVSELVGTMAAREGASEAVRADAIKLDLQQVGGAVNLYEAGSVLVLEFDLAPRQPIEVVAAYQGGEARFSRLAEPGERGPQRYAISFAKAERGESAVNLKFFASVFLLSEISGESD